MTINNDSSDQRTLLGKCWRGIVSVFSFFTTAASFLANVAVVAGIYFVISQINLSVTMEKRRIAIEAVNQARSAEFLKAYRQLKSVCKKKPRQVSESEQIALADPFNHLVNVYDHIERIYVNNLADRCIIRDGVLLGVKDMSNNICGECTSSCTSEFKVKIHEFVNLMEKEPCPLTRPHLSILK